MQNNVGKGTKIWT